MKKFLDERKFTKYDNSFNIINRYIYMIKRKDFWLSYCLTKDILD